MSWVYRNLLPGTPVLEQTKVKNVVAFKVSLLGQYGGSKYHHDIQPACYRMHRGGVWSMQSDEQKEYDHINTWFWLSAPARTSPWGKPSRRTFCSSSAHGSWMATPPLRSSGATGG
ncbi:MAG: hypothetical protein AAFX65_11740 [Cyanobacteria bacterium J06638_7]